MSLEELRADLALNSDVKALARVDVMVREYMQETVWPWLSSLLDWAQDQEDAIGELIEQTEDFLHAETAEELGKPLGIGLTLAAELEKRLQPGDQALRKVIGEYRASAAQAIATLRDISIADEDEDDEEGAPANGNTGAADADEDEDDDDDDDDDEGEEVTP